MNVTLGGCGGGGSGGGGVTYVVDGIVMPAEMIGFFEHMLFLGVGFVQCPYNVCSVTTDDGQVARFRAYADGSSGYETGVFVGYSPAQIVGSMQSIEYATEAPPIDHSTLNQGQQDQLNELADALGVAPAEIKLYLGPDGGLFAIGPSDSLTNLTENPDYKCCGDSSLFHGNFSVDARENTANGMYSFHITMLDPTLVSLIGWGSQNYLYMSDLHYDLYNWNQNHWGHICQVLGLCH